MRNMDLIWCASLPKPLNPLAGKTTEDDEEEEEIEDDINTPDYLDFDTDYITITMERDYPDFR